MGVHSARQTPRGRDLHFSVPASDSPISLGPIELDRDSIQPASVAAASDNHHHPQCSPPLDSLNPSGSSPPLSVTETTSDQPSSLTVTDSSTSNRKRGSNKAPNFSRVLGRKTTTLALPTIMEHKVPAHIGEVVRNRWRANQLKRWDPVSRTVTQWDDLHRDPELWNTSGNCLVHLCKFGQSRRGASYCVPVEIIEHLGFNCLFETFETQAVYPAPSQKHTKSQRNTQQSPAVCELFIPAPDDTPREDTFRWHTTTRNFFAFVLGLPLVGTHLGQTLIELQSRINLFRPDHEDNESDMLEYLEHVGYTDFGHCPDFALGCLNFAERFQIRDLWIDAFTHCVGMNEHLSDSPEFEQTTSVTQALITRAFLEMDLHLTRVTRSLNNFLEDLLSPAKLALTPGARAHLERFRSFVQSFYVDKFGYWPPPASEIYPKSVYRSMYFDFRHLHDLLVDLSSTDELRAQKPASGGICVLQTVHAFDKRNRYLALPHPLPLLPSLPSDAEKSRSGRTRMLKLAPQQNKAQQLAEIRDALDNSTNTRSLAVVTSPLVKAYQRFERDWSPTPEEKVSISDARKVRWLLVYGTLQVLISVMRAPKEVRDTEGPAYPMCCTVAKELPWEAGIKALKGHYSLSVDDSVSDMSSFRDAASVVDSAISEEPSYTVEPDCEPSDFIAASTTASQQSQSLDEPISEVDEPSHERLPVATRSLPSTRRTLRNLPLVRKRAAIPAQPTRRNFCEIVIEGYGNGLSEPSDGSDDASSSDTVGRSAPASPTSSFSSTVDAERDGRMLSQRTRLQGQDDHYKLHGPRSPPSEGSLDYYDDVTEPFGEHLSGNEAPRGRSRVPENVRRNGSLNSDSSTSSGSVFSPLTPSDEQMLAGTRGPFDFEFGTPSLQRLELPVKSSIRDDASSVYSEDKREDAVPGHGIRIKRTFSVESIVVTVQDVDYNNTNPLRRRDRQIAPTAAYDYLRNNLNRSGSVSRVQSNNVDRSHSAAGFSLPRSLSRRRSNRSLRPTSAASHYDDEKPDSAMTLKVVNETRPGSSLSASLPNSSQGKWAYLKGLGGVKNSFRKGARKAA